MNDPVALIQKAFGLQQSGAIDDAAAIYGQLLQSYPDNPQLLHLLGSAELERGNTKLGVSLLRRCVKLVPGEAEIWSDLGIGLERMGRYAEACDSFERALKIQPQHPGILRNRANVLLILNRPTEALASIDRAVKLAPGAAPVHLTRGVVLLRLGRQDEALVAFERALALDSGVAAAHLGRGDALMGLARPEEALAACDRALVLAPDFVDALLSRAKALLMLRRPADALTCLDRALDLDPGFAAAQCNRAAALRALNRFEEAEAAYDRALELEPGNPEAHIGKAHLLLNLGRLSAGWAEYEWRWKVLAFKELSDSFGKPRWRRDQPVAGKTVLLWAEQGLGDTIQFSRFIPLVQAAGAKVVVEVQPALVELLTSLKDGFEIIAVGTPRPVFDLQCPLASLPYVLKADRVPAEIPYLFADAGRCDVWRQRLGPKSRPRIGLSWSGQAFNPAEPERRIPLGLLQPLLDLPYAFYVLQKDLRPDDEPARAQLHQLVTYPDALMDFACTAALAAQMDLVIANDGSIAHLAGALGLPLWLLLGRDPDVRWIEPNPWYPAARIFRRAETRSWEQLIADVVAQLSEWMARPS
jgi:tetratricopeptide (TPR) repeat protein